MAVCSQAKKIHWNRFEKISCGFQLECYEGPCIKCSNATITESEENWTVCCVMWILVAAALLCVILFSGSLTEQKWAIEIEPHASFLRPNVNRGRDILHEDLTDQSFNQYDCVISITSPESKQWNLPPKKGPRKSEHQTFWNLTTDFGLAITVLQMTMIMTRVWTRLLVRCTMSVVLLRREPSGLAIILTWT